MVLAVGKAIASCPKMTFSLAFWAFKVLTSKIASEVYEAKSIMSPLVPLSDRTSLERSGAFTAIEECFFILNPYSAARDSIKRGCLAHKDVRKMER